MRFKLGKKLFLILATFTVFLFSVTYIIHINTTIQYEIPRKSKILYDSNISFHFVVNNSAASSAKNAEDIAQYELFFDRLTPKDVLLMEELLGVIDEVFTNHSIQYFMCCGTLLGSYRYMDRLPWDDDVDIVIPFAQKYRVFKLLNSYDTTQYRLTVWGTYQAKFSSKTRQRIQVNRAITFPYVDMFFYYEKNSFLELNSVGSKIPKLPVFPLTRRPFGKLWLPSPCDPEPVLASFYGNLSSCKSPSFDHRKEQAIWRFTEVDCESLNRWSTRIERMPRQLIERDDRVVDATRMNPTSKRLYNQVERLYMRDQLLREILIVGVC